MLIRDFKNAPAPLWLQAVAAPLKRRSFGAILISGLATLFGTGAVAASPPDRSAMEFFEKKIRPLLAARCYECHSQRATKLGGKLALDSRGGWQAGGEGGPIVVAGRPEESRLIKAVQWSDEEVHMPPKQRLSESEVALLVEWVRRGAPDPRDGRSTAPAPPRTSSWESIYQERRKWWSLRPVAHPALPATRRADWPREPLDQFILAKLEERGLAPAREADEAALARRATFALTGLPPSPDELRQFLADRSVGGYERLVDRLLASPQFGERWARHWMDVVHYADTHGYEWDIPAKHAWRYRDYLVRAYNADLPYRQLVLEQLAGDLLDSPRIDPQTGLDESLIGPMSLRLGERRHGDNSEFDGITQEAMDNVIDTVSKAYLATTVACAHCHDHKLDALAQHDYYAWAGIFMSSRWVARSLNRADPNRDAIAEQRRLKQDIRRLLEVRWQQSIDRAERSLATVLANSPALGDSADVKSWRAVLSASQPPVEEPAFVLRELFDGQRKGIPVAAVWSRLAADYKALHETRLATNRRQARLLADFTRGSVPKGWSIDGLGLANGFARDGDFAVMENGPHVLRHLLPAGLYSHLYSNRLAGVIRSPLWGSGASAAALKTAEQFLAMEVVGGGFAAAHPVVDHALFPERAAYLDLPYPTFIQQHTRLTDGVKDRRVYFELATLELNNNYPARVGVMKGNPNDRSWFGVTRIYGGAPPQDELTQFVPLFEGTVPKTPRDAARRLADWLRQAVTRWRQNRAGAADVSLLNWMLRHKLLPNAAEETKELAAVVARYRVLERSLQPDCTVGSIADLAEARDERVGVRGSYSELAEVVPRGNIRFLAELGERPAERTSGRLELARCLASPNNPLTARVYVNRVWSALFGEGLVRTTDDFGHLGEKPSHPQLLDYLAQRFLAEGWSTKRLVRSIVLSATWRQSGEASAESLRQDPENRLWHHFPLRRLEAEELRDAVLAVSGRLDRKLFGPPIDPYRSSEDDQKRLFCGPLDGNGRRSVYIKMTLMEPPKFLAEFNQPLPKLTTGHRDVTNVPNQALALMNDPFVALEARFWAERSIRDGATTGSARLERMLARALGRRPDPAECDRFEQFLNRIASLRGVKPDKVLSSVDVWQDAAHAIYNLKEFLYVR